MPNATKTSRDRAQAHERDRRKIENIGIKAAPAIARAIRTNVVKQYRAGYDIIPVLREGFAAVQVFIADLMVASYLQGTVRSVQTAAPHIAKNQLAFAAEPYAGAVEFAQKRLDLTDEEVQSLKAQYGREAATVTREAEQSVERAAQEAIAEIVDTGAHVQEGMGILRDKLSKAGLDNVKPYLLEALVRSQTQIAYSAGRWRANQDPAIQEILWGYEYVTVGDDRVRPNHVALDGTRLPKDSPMWNDIFPPNGFSCRCTTIEIFNDERIASEKQPPAEATVDGKKVIPGADDGWDFNPGKVVAGGPGAEKAIDKTQDLLKKSKPVKKVAKKRVVKPKPAKKKPAVKKIKGIQLEANGKPITETDKRLIGRYTAADYDEIVKAQLGKPLPPFSILDEKGALKQAKQTENALKKLPGVKAKSYRGLKFGSPAEQKEFLKQFETDGVHQFKAFQSTSTEKKVADSFLSEKDTTKSVMMVIDGKSGRDVQPYSRNKREAELLFMKGSTFRVSKVVDNVIHLVEL